MQNETKTSKKNPLLKLDFLFLIVTFILTISILFKLNINIFEPEKVVLGSMICAMFALIFAFIRIFKIKENNCGNEKMQEIASYISKGAMAFLKREYKLLSIFVAFLFIFLYKFVSLKTGICFLCGAFCSALAGFIGMKTSTMANLRTTEAAKKSLNKALRVSFSGGAVMGMTVVGLGLLGLSILYYIFKDANIVNGFALGGSSIALFARVGGGIYTKAADVGADLVGKIESNIPEDDYRNPAVIADNVGDNVGDVAGMGADLFESFVGSIIAAMTLGCIYLGLNGVIIPLMISSFGTLASICATYLVRTDKKANPMLALNFATLAATLLSILGSYFTVKHYIPQYFNIFWAIVSGLLCGMFIGLSTEYYTSSNYRPVKNIAKSSLTGSATNIISGLDTGMMSTGLPVVLISIAIITSYKLCCGYGNGFGVWAIAMSAVGMLSITGMIVSVDAYGPISDNAGGIAEMSGLDPSVREKTDKLDSVGNTTAAIGKGFAIGSAALTALTLLTAYCSVTDIKVIDLLNPMVIVGLLIGSALPFIFCALTLGAVGRAAEKMVNEVRCQFTEIKGIMEGFSKPNYARCVDISTTSAIKEMFLPGSIAVLGPIFFGYIFKAEALAGLLIGSILSGVCLAIFLANAGGAWDNAKKYIESGTYGGKGSQAHKAAVCGDTVGDPCKDTAGPSLNILLKLMTIVSLVFSSLFI